MGWIIVRRDHGRTEYVVAVCVGSSFTCDIRKAKRFSSREAAQAECCENERVERLEDHLS